MKALVVDDSRAMRTILGQILKSLGFSVIEAGDGVEGLDQLSRQGPADLALVDWNMPSMNGLEFVRAVRASSVYDAMKLMMITSETEISRIAAALEVGANEYVMKPFTRDVILQKLEVLGIASS